MASRLILTLALFYLGIRDKLIWISKYGIPYTQ